VLLCVLEYGRVVQINDYNKVINNLAGSTS